LILVGGAIRPLELPMFNLPGRQPPPFSLDRKTMAQAAQRRQLSRTEWRMLIFLPVLMIVIAWTIYDWRGRMGEAMDLTLNPIPAEARLTPMGRPLYESLPALPGEAEIAELRAPARELVAIGQPVPLTASGLDAMTMAWAEASLDHDRQTPPLPQRLAARELVLSDHVRLGTPLIVEGQLEDRLPAPVTGAERSWQRLLVALEEGQFVEVVSDAPAAAQLPLGRPVRVTGRLLGYGDLATAGGGTQHLPLILGRALVEPAVPSQAGDALAEYQRAWSQPEGLYAGIDDARLWVETRPYYYLLGQLLRERSTPEVLADAPDGNQAADDVHLRPDEFRGKPFRITGYVYQAWEDQDVKRDQPFGVGRVVRVMLWRRDIAPVTESLDGVETRKIRQVLRLYEWAAVTDQPLPKRGDYLTATGRFLKKRAIAVDADPRRDQANNVQRQSDRVYTWLYATGPWQQLEGPATYNLGALGWVSGGIAFVMLILGVYWWRREATSLSMQQRTQLARAERARIHAERQAAKASSQPAKDGQAPPSP
jgi:hypothetical protein